MTDIDRFERDLSSLLASAAPTVAPTGLHAEAMEGARHGRQRPSLVVALRGGTITPTPGRPRPERRVSIVLVVVALVLASLVLAIAGVVRLDRPEPLGDNGPVAFTFQGNVRTAGGTRLVGAGGTADLTEAPWSMSGCPKHSRDGSVLVSYAEDPRSFVVTDTATLASTRVPVEGLDASWHPHFGSFDVSPDGRRIAWLKSDSDGRAVDPTWERRHFEVWVTSVVDGIATRVAAAPADREQYFGIPIWSPDGRRLAVEIFSRAGSFHRAAIDVVDLETGIIQRVTDRLGILGGVSWSPDGRLIAFLGLPDGTTLPIQPASDPPQASDPRPDVFVVALDGSGERNVTNSRAFEQQPAWSPDGERLAYLSSDDADGFRLTSLPMDGADPVGPPVFGPESEYLVWSPDATALLWVETAPLAPRGTRSTVRSIDRDLRGTSATIAVVDGSLLCMPSWQSVPPKEP